MCSIDGGRARGINGMHSCQHWWRGESGPPFAAAMMKGDMPGPARGGCACRALPQRGDPAATGDLGLGAAATDAAERAAAAVTASEPEALRRTAVVAVGEAGALPFARAARGEPVPPLQGAGARMGSRLLTGRAVDARVISSRLTWYCMLASGRELGSDQNGSSISAGQGGPRGGAARARRRAKTGALYTMGPSRTQVSPSTTCPPRATSLVAQYVPTVMEVMNTAWGQRAHASVMWQRARWNAATVKPVVGAVKSTFTRKQGGCPPAPNGPMRDAAHQQGAVDKGDDEQRERHCEDEETHDVVLRKLRGTRQGVGRSLAQATTLCHVHGPRALKTCSHTVLPGLVSQPTHLGPGKRKRCVRYLPGRDDGSKLVRKGAQRSARMTCSGR